MLDLELALRQSKIKHGTASCKSVVDFEISDEERSDHSEEKMQNIGE